MQLGRIIHYKTEAGVLSLVLSFSLIIAMLCSAMIFLAYFYRINQLRSDIDSKNLKNAQSGLNYIMANIDQLEPSKQYILDLYKNEKDSVALQHKPWGVFSIGISNGFSGKQNQLMAGMIGAFPNQLTASSALYLVDEQKPLSIAGNSKITGNSHLPKAGITPGYINKISYSRDKLVYGSILNSTSKLPEINSKQIAEIENQLSISLSDSQNEIEDVDNFAHSFLKETIHFSQQKPIFIDQNLNGNIIIESATKVIVRSNAILENIIIKAPYVAVESGFEGSIQIFATDTILIGRNSHFKYPSALVVLDNNQNGLIDIEPECTIEGEVILNGNDANYNTRILNIHKSAKVVGKVFANAMVIHEGEISGHISCRKFLLITPSAIYENYLLDAQIDQSALHKKFLGGTLWGASERKGIVKWVL